MSDPLIPVAVGPCRCPGTPHSDGDTVSMYPKLPLDAGLEAHAAMSVIADGVKRLAAVYRISIEAGIGEWTFVDDKGQSIPINPETIRELLTYGEGGEEVREKATELYGAALLAPFRQRQERSTKTPSSSPHGPTAKASTSRTRGTSLKTVEPS